MVLLHVLPEEAQVTEAMDYLLRVARELLGDASRWRCEVAVSRSVSASILDVATPEGADLIAMYNQDDHNLVSLLKGGTTANVRLWAPIEVKVSGFRNSLSMYPQRLAAWKGVSSRKPTYSKASLKIRETRWLHLSRG